MQIQQYKKTRDLA